MKKLRKPGAAVSLAFALAMSVAGETPTPSCGSTEPGQIPTPPCAVQLAPGGMNTSATSTAPGEIGTPAVASETSVTRMAADVLLIFLPLF